MARLTPAPTAGPCRPLKSHAIGTKEAVAAADGRQALASSATKPQPKKIQMISFSVQAVMTPLMAKSAIRIGSLPTVVRASL